MNAAKQELETVTPAELEIQKAEAWLKLGAIRAADAIAGSLSSQTIRGLQQFRDQKLYRALGFNRFDDFLGSDHSLMSYEQFNRLEKAIKNEGDELFDFLNAIDAPLSKRKLLGRGDVRVEGKEIVVQEGEHELRVPLNSPGRILSVLSRVVDQRNEQKRTIERGRKQVVGLKKRLDEAKNNANGHAGQGGFHDALLNVVGSFSLLAHEVEKLPEDQRKELQKSVYATVGEHMKRVDEAFGLKMPKEVKKRGAVIVPDHLLEDEEGQD